MDGTRIVHDGCGGTTTRGLNMQVTSGKPFWPLDPDPRDVSIRDIARALSMTCRYGGHVKAFYSVAQHSIELSKLVHVEHRLAALLHDASEAYVGDLIRPIKLMLPEFVEIEKRVERAVAERFHLPDLCPPEVKDADTRIVANEMRDLLAEPDGVDWGRLPLPFPELPRGHFAVPLSPLDAEREFLNRYTALSGDTTWM